jgi:pSer/pThr/pTyr-binding forkhead associated (FHA) protein
MPKIIVQKDSELVNTFNLPGKEVVSIGSSSGCDVPLEDPSVASEQAKILLKDDGFHLQLVTHIPAVFVTDERVEGDVKLEDGDTISIEDFNLILNVLPDEIKVVEPPPPPPPPPPPLEPIPVKKEEPAKKEILDSPQEQIEKPSQVEPPIAPVEVPNEPKIVESPVKEELPPPAPVPETEPEIKPEPAPPLPQPKKEPEVMKEPVKEVISHIKTEEIRIEPKPVEPSPEPEPVPEPPPPPPEPKPEPVPEPKPEPPPPPPPTPKPEPPPVVEKEPEPEPVKKSAPEPIEKKKAPKPERKTKLLPQMDYTPPDKKESGAMYLLALSGSLKGEKFKLKNGPNKIGRDRKKNDIVIREDSKGQLDKSISRQHAIVDCVDDSYYLSDKTSQMRTKLNNKTISTSENIKLKSGDIIEICSMKESTVFRFSEEGKFDFSPPGKSVSINIGDKNLQSYIIIGAAVIIVIVILILLLK